MFLVVELVDSPEKRKTLVRQILKQCLQYVTREAQFLDRRLKAIKQATSIIETKLRYATGLDSDGKGNIVLIGSVAEYQKEQEVKKAQSEGGLVKFTAIAGGKGGDS